MSHSSTVRHRRLRLRQRKPLWSRRALLVTGVTGAASGAWAMLRRLTGTPPGRADTPAPVRPPTASPSDDTFRAACIRCGLCGTVCENGCIRYFGLDEPEHGALTPYLDLRSRSCTLCMRCTEVCPTGALSRVAPELDVVAKEVRMGTAVVDPDLCLSFQGRICGYCHDACPLPGTAIRLVPRGKPVVLAEGCVGCGRCVELCPQQPTAIEVIRRTA